MLTGFRLTLILWFVAGMVLSISILFLSWTSVFKYVGLLIGGFIVTLAMKSTSKLI